MLAFALVQRGNHVPSIAFMHHDYFWGVVFIMKKGGEGEEAVLYPNLFVAAALTGCGFSRLAKFVFSCRVVGQEQKWILGLITSFSSLHKQSRSQRK